VKDETRRVNLTSREGQVVALRAMERGFDVIAEQLGISEAMVRRVYARARRKIDRKTR
jgi:DNA-directed RNA polymerase specialized sigma24 family protein